MQISLFCYDFSAMIFLHLKVFQGNFIISYFVACRVQNKTSLMEDASDVKGYTKV